jgi:hypothetical protein
MGVLFYDGPKAGMLINQWKGLLPEIIIYNIDGQDVMYSITNEHPGTEGEYSLCFGKPIKVYKLV